MLNSDEALRRVIWIAPAQRQHLQDLLRECLSSGTCADDRQVLTGVLIQLGKVEDERRLSGRVLSNHVTGLRLPNGAVPVRLTEAEGVAVLGTGLCDRRLTRMLTSAFPPSR